MLSKIKTMGKMLKAIKNPSVYLMDYAGLKKGKPLIYKLRNGVKYNVRGGDTDRFIINEIWLHRSYNPEGFEIGEEDTVVDIGAHIGVFTLMASHYAKNGDVFAFEPVKGNFDLLKKNIELNNATNVKPINKAASDSDGEMSLFISESRNKGQNSSKRLAQTQKEEKVKTTSFKNFLSNLEKVDFLKIDCEGGEYKIIHSLDDAELGKIKKISMEYHNYGFGTGQELKSLLERKGFEVRMIEDGSQFGTIYAKQN